MGIVLVTALGALAVPLWRRLVPRATTEQCEALLERRAEQVARAMDPDGPSSAIAARRVASPARGDVIARCTAKITRDEALCAMGSQSADEFERCLP